MATTIQRLAHITNQTMETQCFVICVCVCCLVFTFLVWCLFDCFRALGNLSLELLARPVGYMPRDAGDQQMQKTCLGTRPTQRKAGCRNKEKLQRTEFVGPIQPCPKLLPQAPTPGSSSYMSQQLPAPFSLSPRNCISKSLS